MTQPILPKLKDSHNVDFFEKYGEWDVRPQDSLKKLSSGLKVDKVETEINSIPDMWARPMLFEMALLNPDHVLHKRILGEWRGMLAMLGLKEILGLNELTAAPVTLPQLARSKNGDEPSPVAEHRNFLLTLTKLLPKASLAADTSWRYLYVFLYGENPFGMTSPTTLVSTAADCLNRISTQDVRWFDGTHLMDPVEILPPRQKQILSGWLSNLITSINRHTGVYEDRWNLILGLLRAFRNELGAGESVLGQSSLGIQGQEAGIFRYLDKAAEDNRPAPSHVTLLTSEGRSPSRPLLVFDRTIADQWNMSAQNVTVDGAQTLATAHPVARNAELWRREDFFNKKLFVIFQENAFPGTLGGGNQSLTLPGANSNVTPILPLNSKLMQYLTAEDLAQRVKWERTPEGLVLRLFLQLSGPRGDGGKEGRIELTKVYKREDIQTLDNVPILEIWPNFKAAGWQAYYTCYSTDDVTGTFTATPFFTTTPIKSEVPLGGRRQRLYWQSTTYPEAIICSARVADEKSSQREVSDAGLLLLAAPQDERRQGKTYKVGIDFGAASTTICASSIGPVKFKNRKTSITASGDNAQAQLFDFFVPRSESEMPVLSFFQDFNNDIGNAGLRPFLDGHAYLLETAESFNPKTTGLAFDLKWSRDNNDRKRVTAFLTQLCLQTAAELVVQGGSSATWSFSYPTAFSEDQIQGFPSIWTQVTTECARLSGLRQERENKRRSESEAAAIYFVTHRKAATALGTVFIDIGGSTSDISVWQDNRPVWQTSVLLAGRSIFSNYLWHRPEFLEAFGIDISRLVELKNAQSERKVFHASTDVLLRYNSDKIFQNLPLHAGTEAVTHLRQHLALGVCGLFYYVGGVLRYLINEGRYRPELPNVFLAGNGSRMFRWLDIDKEGQINSLYKAMFSAGAHWPDQAFKVTVSDEPKLEAAYGLVSDWEPPGNKEPTSDEQEKKGVLAGESFILEPEGALGWNTILTKEMLTKDLRPPKKLDRMLEFIDTFNQFARTRGLVPPTDLNDGELEEARRRLGQNLARYRGSDDTSSIVVEPIFIVAMRQWLDVRLGN